MRYGARHVLWGLSHDKRRRECGRGVRSADGVKVKVTTVDGARHAGWSGLSTCGSVWSCPVCSAKIANARQAELLAAITEWTRRGGRIGFGTVTMRHYAHHELTRLWDGLSGARHAMLSGRAWQAEQRDAGVLMPRVIHSGSRAGDTVLESRIPVVGVVEGTHGVNGWHLHLHMVLFLSAEATSESFDLLGSQLFMRWRDSLGAAGLPLPNFRHGKDFQLVEGDAATRLADYFCKGQYEGSIPDFAAEAVAARRGISLEVTRSDMKDASHGNKTPFGLLRGLVEVTRSGDMGVHTVESIERDTEIWHEWERCSAGRRQISWTPGLREFLGVGALLTDDELAAKDFGNPDEVHGIDSLTHKLIIACRADGQVLTAFERSELDGWRFLSVFSGAADYVISDRLSLAEAAVRCRRRLRAAS